MSFGKSIPKEIVNEVMDALEKAGIDCNIWNVGDFLDPSYHGKIDIESEARHRKDDFIEIIRKVETRIQEKHDRDANHFQKWFGPKGE